MPTVAAGLFELEQDKGCLANAVFLSKRRASGTETFRRELRELTRIEKQEGRGIRDNLRNSRPSSFGRFTKLDNGATSNWKWYYAGQFFGTLLRLRRNCYFLLIPAATSSAVSGVARI
jgi:hypothetical protein